MKQGYRVGLAGVLGLVSWGVLGWSGLDPLAREAAWRWRGPREAPVKIAYVTVDGQSVGALGGAPLKHAYLARALDRLFDEAQVSCVGITYGLSDYRASTLVDPQLAQEDHDALSAALARQGRVVLGVAHTKELDVQGPRWGVLREAPEPWARLAFAQGLVDRDPQKPPAARWVPARQPPALALELVRCHYGGRSIRYEQDRVFVEDAKGQVLVQAPLYAGRYLSPSWFQSFASEDLVSLTLEELIDPLQGGLSQKALKGLKDAIVLVGQGPPLKRLQALPLDPGGAPAMAIQGALVQSLAAGACLHFVPSWVGLLVCVLFAWGVLVCLERLSGWKLVGLLMGAFLSYTALAYVALIERYWALPLVAVLQAGLCALLFGFLWRLYLQEKEKRKIKDLFSTYVAQPFVEKLVAAPQPLSLEGEEHVLTAFFTDLGSFSAVAEVLQPQEVVRLMNDYLGVMTRLLQAQGGTLDKYIGDAIVAFFGAPVSLQDHAVRACQVALLIQQEHTALLARWDREGWPPIVQRLSTRIGIHTGPAIVGNIGSAIRFNYTMMGDSVNLAARGVEACKTHNVPIIVTEATYRAVRVRTQAFQFRALGPTALRGRSTEVSLYALEGF